MFLHIEKGSVSTSQNIRHSGWKETFSRDALGLNRKAESERNKARGRKKKLFLNWSVYTLPALSATQAESTPKIKYTLHLGTNKIHSVK